MDAQHRAPSSSGEGTRGQRMSRTPPCIPPCARQARVTHVGPAPAAVPGGTAVHNDGAQHGTPSALSLPQLLYPGVQQSTPTERSIARRPPCPRTHPGCPVHAPGRGRRPSALSQDRMGNDAGTRPGIVRGMHHVRWIGASAYRCRDHVGGRGGGRERRWHAASAG